MPKPKQKLDPRIKREVTAQIRTKLISALDSYIERNSLTGTSVFDATYLKEHLFSKYVDENTDSAETREHRAIVKWLGVEQLNQRTNLRLFQTDPYFYGVGFGHDILRKAAKLIKRTIGPMPPEGLLERGSFSGGATTSVKRSVGTLARKFTGNRDVTPDAWEVLKDVLPEFKVWTLYEPGVDTPRLVKGNVLFTVPKTALIDRVACKEPDYNIFAQKAVGDHIRDRLRKRAKIDLNDQSINRRLAYQGSVSGKLATIDLSSASDSVTTGLVSLLLPFEWFRLLDALRCPKTFIKGRSHVNAMFSSMGNGFTFELESLIFWAIAHVVRGTTRSFGEVSVYGDDIIVPTSCAGVLIQILSWVGFRTNVKKTFYKGPFRESCGGHYYGGLDVTPFYVRAPIRDISDLILFLNQYRRWLIITSMDTVDGGWERPNVFTDIWYHFAAFVPKVLWGGSDLDSRVQLCSPGKQRCELLRTRIRHERSEAELQTGLYLSRLSQMDRRSNDTYETEFSSLVSPGVWVLRRCKFQPEVFGLVKPLFTFEQLG